MGGFLQPRARAAGVSAFPQVVAWASLGLALLLFFGNTVPAVRERAALRATAADLERLRARYDEALLQPVPGTQGAPEDDLESVLVAIDRIGWTPAELLRAYPPPEESGARGR
jgi:hypothetical protein